MSEDQQSPQPEITEFKGKAVLRLPLVDDQDRFDHGDNDNPGDDDDDHHDDDDDDDHFG